MRLSLILSLSLLRLACCWTPQTQTSWQEVSIRRTKQSSTSNEQKAVEHFQSGEAVLLLKHVVNAEECRKLVSACAPLAEAHRDDCRQKGIDHRGTSRLPILAAAQRASVTNTPCADPLHADTSALCEDILLRVATYIDSCLPSLASTFFAGPIRDLILTDSLTYASREPAINVYTTGGQFLAHEDGQKLTVLIPLGNDFDGGGTGFWSPNARGHRVEPPTVVLKPSQGTALLFAGHVTHAGIAVERGHRFVLVASFSPKL